MGKDVAEQRQRVVIVGAGFAGAYCAAELLRLDRSKRLDVTLIDQRNHLIFHPLLVEAGTGALEPRHTVVSIRAMCPDVDFRMGRVTGIDLPARRVTLRLQDVDIEQRIDFDHLVLALGSVTRRPGSVPGLSDCAFEIKSLADAVNLRDRAIEMLELADAVDDPGLRRELLHWVVVGGNFTGVEVAGEFMAFMQEAAHVYPRLKPSDCTMTLVDRASRILSALDEELSEYAKRQLTRRGIRVLTNMSVTAMDERSATLSDGQVLPTRTVVWCAGIAPPPLLAELGLPLDGHGYLRCDPDLRVTGSPHVWGVGDCAANPDPSDAQGRAYPATAQHAVREGKAAAANILRAVDGLPTQPLVYASQGSLAPLGCRTAVARIGPFKFSGFVAWFLWRTVYWLKMPGLSRKLRISLDWTAGLFFRREYVQLGVHRRAASTHADRPTPQEVTV